MNLYVAKVIEKIGNDPGIINSLRVGVFRVENNHEEQIGEYVRNYSTLFKTFFPFRKNGTDYALYSPNYTATRVMELPSCRDIGGEEPSGGGFCPVEFYVPSYIEKESIDTTGQTHRYRHNEPDQESFVPYEKNGFRTYPIGSLTYYSFGFVAGCIWGYDSSWKIQYLDLAKVENGLIRREERFGYIALPNALDLKQAINLYDYLYDPNEDDAYRVTIAIQKQFDLRTGKMLDE